MKKYVFLLLTLLTVQLANAQRKNNVNVNANIWFLGLQYERALKTKLSASVTIGFPKNMFQPEEHIRVSSGEVFAFTRKVGFNHRLELNYYPFSKPERPLHGFNIGVYWTRKHWVYKTEYLDSSVNGIIDRSRIINTLGPRWSYQWAFESGFNFSLSSGVMFLRNVEKTNPVRVYSNFDFTWPELEASIGFSF